MPTTRVFAPAKINLTLHVTGLRDDGYHLLDSLVAFASIGDWIDIAPAAGLTLSVMGPHAPGVPVDKHNLALRAASLVEPGGAALTLMKSLPVASGIGGGSADAAAAFRGMLCFDAAQAAQLANAPEAVLAENRDPLLSLGADVPMCLLSAPMRVQGIGETLTRTRLPDVPAMLVNPRVPVATPPVFKALRSKDNAPMPATLPGFETASDLIDWLSGMRNDLQAPAIETAPVIATVLEALEALPGCRLARMSGSGATCFALFDSAQAAQEARWIVLARHPDWWSIDCTLGDQSQAALPKSAPAPVS